MTNAVKTISPEDLERRIREAGKADLSILPRDFDVMLVGEFHHNYFVRHHLKANITALKSLGIGVYGAEAPIKYKRQFHKVYDSYRRGGKRYVAPPYVLFGPTRDPRKDKSYRALARLFAERGVHIFPFDMRQFGIYKNGNGENINPKEEESTSNTIRDNMTEQDKTLVLIGHKHLRRINSKPTVVDYLEEAGYKCITIMYYGGCVTERGYTIGAHIVEAGAIRANRDYESFLFKNPSNLIPPGSDYIIHLPQKIILSNQEEVLERVTIEAK